MYVNIFVFIIPIYCSISLVNSVDNADNITLAIVILKPGLYNPTTLLPTDEHRGIWAWQGPGLLSNIGKLQSFVFGQHLRNKYSYLIDPEYYPDQMIGITSSIQRCQQTLLSLYAGLYPTTHVSQFQADLKWQPVPVKIDDEALRPMENCIYYEKLKDKFEQEIAAKTAARDEDSALMIYLAKKSGLNPDIKSLADIDDNWKSMNSLKVQQPAYLENPSIEGYNKPLMQEKLTNLTGSYQNLCQNDPTCRQIAAGHWLYNILDVINHKINGSFIPSMLINVADSDNVDSLIELLGLTNDIPTINDTSTSGLILEMAHKGAEAQIRLAYHYLGSDRKYLYPKLTYCNAQEWCPMSKFLDSTRAKILPNFSAEKLCNKSPIVSVFNGILGAMLIIFYLVKL